MKALGYILITIAFLAASLVSVWEKIEIKAETEIQSQVDDTEEIQKDKAPESSINWLYFGICMSIGIAGIALVRISGHKERRCPDLQKENLQLVQTSLQAINDNIKKLNNEAPDMSPYDVHHRIDELFPSDITAFVDARHSIAHSFSLAAYAEVMDHFAAGERYLNRVWSASTDGYIDEVKMYLDMAEKQFETSLQSVMKFSNMDNVQTVN